MRSVKFKQNLRLRTLFCVLLSSGACLCAHSLEASRFRLISGYQYVASNNRTGDEVFGSAEVRYLDKNKFIFSYLRDTRLFQPSVKLIDDVFSFGHVLDIGSGWYFEKSLSFSKDPDFSPNWRLQIAPAFAFQNGQEASLGFVYSRYSNLDTIQLQFWWLIPVDSKYQIRFRADSNIQPSFSLSLQQVHTFQLFDRIKAKVILAGGKTDEGDSNLAGFFSGTSELQYDWSAAFSTKLQATLYRGDIRDENRVGVFIDTRF